MARLESQAKAGFYPCPPQVVEFAAARLKPPEDGSKFCVVDPCAGEGDAIIALAEQIGCQFENVYSIELEEGRGEKLKENLADERGGKVLAPCSFFGTSIAAESFSLVWLNPPFDDDQGLRAESRFLEKAKNILKPSGIMVMVCPESTEQLSQVRNFFTEWFDYVSVTPFPAEHRKYKEVIIYGVRRMNQLSWFGRKPETDLKMHADQDFVYHIPDGFGPHKAFRKVTMTDEEIAHAMASSHIMRELAPTPASKPLSPPLELGTGHLALLLASGQLDGMVCPPDEPPHVVRGTTQKIDYLDSQEVEENLTQTGLAVSKTVLAERIVLTVRAVDGSGEIRTFTDVNLENYEPPPPDVTVNGKNGKKKKKPKAQLGGKRAIKV